MALCAHWNNTEPWQTQAVHTEPLLTRYRQLESELVFETVFVDTGSDACPRSSGEWIHECEVRPSVWPSGLELHSYMLLECELCYSHIPRSGEKGGRVAQYITS